MNVRGLALVLAVIMKVVSVKSECDDYLTCLGSFFGNFFNEKDKPPPLDTIIAKDSKSADVDYNKEELNQVLFDVSKFLNEELEVHPENEFKSMVLRKIHNQTAIYVKTFDVGDYFDDSEEANEHSIIKSTSEFLENNNSEVKSKKVIENSTSVEDTQLSDVETTTIVVENIATTALTKALTQNLTKSVRENEIETEGDSYLNYDVNDDNSTDYPILDYIEFYKDTTNEYVNLEPTDSSISVDNMDDNIYQAVSASLYNINVNSTTKNTSDYTEAVDKELATSVFPWIATIFVKNDTSNQFNYYCDGALLSNVAVITAARCVQTSNMTMNNDDVLVFLGKKSLTVMTGAERVVRIKEVKVHENFTASSGNDLAMLIFEERVIFSDSIQPASLSNEDAPAEYIATTGWQTTGDLTPILLKTDEDGRCGLETEADDTFCSVYGNDVTVCPSYGGLYVTKQASWSLQGLRTDDPEDRGLCFKRNIAFTSFKKHANWIQENLQ